MVLAIDTSNFITGLNHDLAAELGSVQYFLPEIVLAASLFIVIVADLLLFRRKSRYISYLSIAGLVAVAGMLFLQGHEVYNVGSKAIFSEISFDTELQFSA